MAVHDLTPQLRTRLSRLEKLVGWFVSLALLLMLFGLGYYVYSTAQRKGWFLTKAPFFLYLRSGVGLRVGDPIKLMGWDVGEITVVNFEDPNSVYDVYIEFVVRAPYYGYIWSDSRVKVKSAGLFGARYLELTKGGTSGSTNKLYAIYKEVPHSRKLDQCYIGNGQFTNYVAGVTKPYWMREVDEPPDISSQMDQVVQTARDAIPNFLALTNRLNDVLSNSVGATAQMVSLLDASRPVMTNLLAITAHLKDPKGSLGDWLFPTNLTLQLTQTLSSANTVLQSANVVVTNSDTHLALLVSNLNVSLESLAGITSNLHAQVDANTNLVTGVNRMIIDTDDMVQGLKRHWLLRSAFKTNKPPQKTTAIPSGSTPATPSGRARSPKDASAHQRGPF